MPACGRLCGWRRAMCAILSRCIVSNGILSRSLSLYDTHSVADVNNALVDDGLVSKEKIGGQNFFWSFPGKQDRLQQIEHQNTLAEMEKLQQELEGATRALEDAKRGREEDEEG